MKLSNFEVKLHDCEPIIALFNFKAICYCISYHLFMKISNKVDIIRKTLLVHTGIGITLGLIGIVHLTMNIEEYSFKHNFIICTKLKQYLIIGPNFSQRYN